MSDPKSIFASKTLWANLVMLLAALLNAKFGIQLDADTQVQLVGGLITAVNIALRLVTSRPVTVSGSASPAIAILLSGTALGLTACSGGQLSPVAQQVVSVLCRADAALQPIAVALAPAAGAEVAALATLDQAVVHPAAVAACASVLTGSVVVGRAVATGG